MHQLPRDIGWIEVICGSMFSGKTEELIRRLRRARFAGQKVQIFKPVLDDRYATGSIASHDQRELECIPLGSVREVYRYLGSDTEVVGFDEAQFFPEGLVRVCEDLADRGLPVIVAALDQDYLGKPFGEIPELLAVSEFVTKNLAICVVCGNPANRSQRLRGGGNTVQVGAADSYEPRCRACFRAKVIGQEKLENTGRIAAMSDMQFEELRFVLSEAEHKYGKNVHIISNPFLLTHLVRLCDQDTTQPAVNRLVSILYRQLIQSVMNNEFPRRTVRVPTRMGKVNEKGVYEGMVINRATKVVSVNIARAGALPSQVCFDALNEILDPTGIRQDHFIVARTTDDDDHVTGATIGASKIGGAVDDMVLLFPDPMGATGSSMSAAIKTYRDVVSGTPAKLITMNLIVTPEYLRRITTEHPDVLIYALRLDRGLSEDAVLRTVPGTFWDREKGLDEKGYIIPGAGGLGEVINNSWV